MAQTAQERRRAQRRTAEQLKRGERPLGGEYQKYAVQSLRRQAHTNFRRKVGNYRLYNDDTVRRHIYQDMDIDSIIWTISADTEEIRSRASDKGYIGIFKSGDNPWWYH